MSDTKQTTTRQPAGPANSSFAEHFRCPQSMVTIRTIGSPSGESGYFRFGEDVFCYGTTSGMVTADKPRATLPDTLAAVKLNTREVGIPFDLDQVTRNLRCEFYAGLVKDQETTLPPNALIRNLYYLARPLMSVGFRKILQRIRLHGKTSNPFPHWPVDRTVDRLFENIMLLAIQSRGNAPIPFIWFWPDAAPAALILTHDVETQKGRDFCGKLMDLDDSFGFKSSFQLIPEKRYDVTEHLLKSIRDRGFEINVHDLNHDGNLFRSRDEFLHRAKRINEYARRFGAVGFRSGILYRNLRWFDAFDFSYDMSVPNVGHLDPQGGGCCTLFPYLVRNVMEIPVTATQDYSLFHILDTYSIDLWKEQCDIILKGNGMISIIVHPDYVIDQKSQEIYKELLGYLSGFRAENKIWATIPREIDRWWRLRGAMNLVQEQGSWKVKGEGSERARVAFAHIKNGRLVYSFDSADTSQPVGDGVGPNYPVEIQPERLGLDSSAREVPSSPRPAQNQIQNQFASRPGPQNPPAPTARESASMGIAVLEYEKPSPQDPVQATPPTLPRKPLRVGMVSYSFYEADNRVMRYAETLAQRGDHVDVFALQRENSPREEILNGVHVHRLQNRTKDEKSRFSYLSKILQFTLRALYQVSRGHLREKYDLLHIHSVPDFIVFTGLLPRLTGTPVILDIHDILPEFYTAKFGGKPESLTFRLLHLVEKVSTAFSSHVIIANHIWKERLLSRSVKAGKCTVVLNSPDRSIFHASGGAKNSNGRFMLLYPGTLNWHQGVDLAIRAFAKISDHVPNADFYVYGEGPSRADLETLAQELHLDNRVFFRKPLPLREVAGIIESADLGIVPKRKDNFGNEAFSTKIFEFMAVGVPVLVADTQVDRYYFDDSVVQFFRGGDVDDLAVRLLALIRDGERRRTLVSNASRYIETVDWTAKRQEYLTLVDDLVEKSRH